MRPRLKRLRGTNCGRSPTPPPPLLPVLSAPTGGGRGVEGPSRRLRPPSSLPPTPLLGPVSALGPLHRAPSPPSRLTRGPDGAGPACLRRPRRLLVRRDRVLREEGPRLPKVRGGWGTPLIVPLPVFSYNVDSRDGNRSTPSDPTLFQDGPVNCSFKQHGTDEIHPFSYFLNVKTTRR